MKKKLSATAVAVACLIIAHAQYPTSLPHHVIDAPVNVHFTDTHNGEAVKCEIPPWTIAGGWHSYFFVNGTKTHIYSVPSSIHDNTLIDVGDYGVGPYLASQPNYKDNNWPGVVENWRLSYHGIYSAHYFVHPQQGGISMAYLSSENKNRVDGGCSGAHYDEKTNNTFNPSITIDCNDGNTYTGSGGEGWIAYHALLTAGWVQNNQSTNWGQQYFNQLGPITWPSNGYYLPDGTRISHGVGGNSSIIEGDYIYIYYLDQGHSNVPGRKRGQRVLRVLKDEALDPYAYKVYYKDEFGNVTWQPSLPAGFTKENMLSYKSVQGPLGTDLFGEQRNTIRFSVAKVRNTNYYIGVEEYIESDLSCSDGGRHFLAIRFSDNLLDWSDRIMNIGSSYCFSDFQMAYPILLSNDGWSNTEVDLYDFYILGAGPGIKQNIHKIRVHYVPPSPGPVNPPKPWECPPGRFCTIEPFAPVVMSNNRPPATAEVFPVSTPSLTNIRLKVTANTKVTMALYDATGRLMEKVEDRYYEKGTYVKQLNMSPRIAGIYFLQVRAGKTYQHIKIIKQ